MTRKNRSRKEDTKDSKGGYCEVCNTDYVNIMVHRRSPQHLTFVRDSNNFRSLDSLIHSEADVTAFLDKTVNGERRSLRKLCNGEAEHEVTNGSHSPQANGFHEVKKPRLGRCRKSSIDTQNLEDRQYYKVIGVNTKLRSSGVFATPRRESTPPNCNGDSPGIVVKFRKVRRSELSVLSDEAEQFMFPRRASTSSSDDQEDEEEDEEVLFTPERRRSLRPAKEEFESTISSERRRLARPTALKEESSEDDSIPDERHRRRKRPGPKRSRLTVTAPAPKLELPDPVVSPSSEIVSSPKEELKERCLKWEDGRLKATPAVEELQFAFESPPCNEPWYESFKRQDQHQILINNVTRIFALYSPNSPKLPYEVGQLPPLKPNCCPLSDLIKKEDRGAGPSRSYGTRGNKKQKIRKRSTINSLIALEKHPRKSPREHASTLAMLGGLLRRKNGEEDDIPTASEDTCSETNSNVKVEVNPVPETQEQSDRLQQFLLEVFDNAADYEVPEEAMEGEPTVATSLNPDVIDLINDCVNCEIIRNEAKEGIANRSPGPGRRGCKFKKKNRTGWPNKKKVCVARVENAKPETVADGAASAESAHDSASELDEAAESAEDQSVASEAVQEQRAAETEGSTEEASSEMSWDAAALQPVVRVAKIDSTIARRLRSARPTRGARSRRARAYRFR